MLSAISTIYRRGDRVHDGVCNVDVGAVVAELTASRAATWAYVTAPTMQTGERYTLSCEDTTQTVTLTAGLNTIGNSSGDFGRPGRPGTPPDGGRPGGWW